MMPAFLQSSMLCFGMEMESGTLQSSRAPFDCGGSQALLLIHQPPDLPASGLVFSVCELEQGCFVEEAKRKVGERPGMGGAS